MINNFGFSQIWQFAISELSDKILWPTGGTTEYLEESFYRHCTDPIPELLFIGIVGQQ